MLDWFHSKEEPSLDPPQKQSETDVGGGVLSPAPLSLEHGAFKGTRSPRSVQLGPDCALYQTGGSQSDLGKLGRKREKSNHGTPKQRLGF